MEKNKKKHYIIYETTNTLNGKTYIGQHQTYDVNDGYMGSGVVLRNAMRRFGKKNFKTRILFDFDNFADMDKKEMELVNMSYIKSRNTYNSRLGGQSGNLRYTPEEIEARREKERLIEIELRKKALEEEYNRKLLENRRYCLEKYNYETNRSKKYELGDYKGENITQIGGVREIPMEKKNETDMLRFRKFRSWFKKGNDRMYFSYFDVNGKIVTIISRYELSFDNNHWFVTHAKEREFMIRDVDVMLEREEIPDFFAYGNDGMYLYDELTYKDKTRNQTFGYDFWTEPEEKAVFVFDNCHVVTLYDIRFLKDDKILPSSYSNKDFEFLCNGDEKDIVAVFRKLMYNK